MKKLALLLLLLLATKSLLAQPTVTSFSPASGEIGTVVTITGTNFSAIPEEDIVYFGGVKAQVTAATTHTLTVTVPASASHQPISVTTSNLTAYSATPFIVTFPGGGVITRTTLGPPLLFPLAALRGPIIHADLDGDGKPEIVVLLSDKICLFRNESIPGNISFASKVDIEAPVEGGAIAVADMDGDGKLDLVTVAPYPSGSRISVFRNTSTIGSLTLFPIIIWLTAISTRVLSTILTVMENPTWF